MDLGRLRLTELSVPDETAREVWRKEPGADLEEDEDRHCGHD